MKSWWSLLLLLWLAVPAWGEAASVDGDHLHVRIITMGPGSDPWEKFGHDCIEIVDDDAGTDISYNWGVFSFGQGTSGFLHFAGHFLQGRLWYMMASDPTGPMLDDYRVDGRSILMQELNLPLRQKLALQARLIAMDTDARRHYLYDYFQKNCATMVRDQIDQSVDGQLAAALKQIPTATTYRWHDRRLTADTPWLYFFLDYSLGQAIDHPLSAWQESFLPERLAAHLREVRVSDGHGRLEPLVKWEQPLATSQFVERDAPPNRFFVFLAIGLGFGGMLYSLACFSRHWPARWAFNLLGVSWSLTAGLLGALMTYAWFSDHTAAMWNENWFQGNPLSLLLVVLIPGSRRWPRAATIIAFAVLGLSAMDLLAKCTPWAFQTNGNMIALALPIHAAIAVGISQRPRRAAPATAGRNSL